MNRCVNKLKVTDFSAGRGGEQILWTHRSVLHADRNPSRPVCWVGILQLTGRKEMRYSLLIVEIRKQTKDPFESL